MTAAKERRLRRRPSEITGAAAWDRGPRKARLIAVSFSHRRVGVIHPSFPLRGRWLTSSTNRKQAPSPSLAIPVARLLKTRPRPNHGMYEASALLSWSSAENTHKARVSHLLGKSGLPIQVHPGSIRNGRALFLSRTKPTRTTVPKNFGSPALSVFFRNRLKLHL